MYNIYAYYGTFQLFYEHLVKRTSLQDMETESCKLNLNSFFSNPITIYVLHFILCFGIND